MDVANLGLFVVASLALILTPGQDMLYVFSRALAQGRAAGVASASGVCLGILAHTALAAFGVGAILQASETLFIAVKLLGAAYLVWLGIRMLRTPAAPIDATGAAGGASVRELVWQGMLSNVTNPKIVLFFVAFLPQFVDPRGAHPTRDLAALGVLYAVMAFPVKAGVGLAAGSLAHALRRRPAVVAWVHRAGGAVLVALGLRLALAPR